MADSEPWESSRAGQLQIQPSPVRTLPAMLPVTQDALPFQDRIPECACRWAMVQATIQVSEPASVRKAPTQARARVGGASVQVRRKTSLLLQDRLPQGER